MRSSALRLRSSTLRLWYNDFIKLWKVNENMADNTGYKNQPFDIILQGGQSNAEGCGAGKTDDEYVPSDDILYMNNDFSITVAQERVWEPNKINDFSLSFAREYLRDKKLAPGRKILILRTAIGGTGFLDKRWRFTDDLYLKMMAMIKTSLELNAANKLVAFIWHQGETDASLLASHDTHYNNLKGLVESVRNTYGYPALPFIAGDFVNEWKSANIAICEPVVAAIKDVCKDIGNAVFVETADLKSNNQDTQNGDTIHFSRNALDLLGKRYYQVWVKL
jgi:hypothetical protein